MTSRNCAHPLFHADRCELYTMLLRLPIERTDLVDDTSTPIACTQHPRGHRFTKPLLHKKKLGATCHSYLHTVSLSLTDSKPYFKTPSPPYVDKKYRPKQELTYPTCRSGDARRPITAVSRAANITRPSATAPATARSTSGCAATQDPTGKVTTSGT